MKKLLTLLPVMLTVFYLSGCIFSNNDKDKASGGLSSNTYLPFKIGATWEYTNTSTYFNSTKVNDYTKTVTGTALYDGKTYWVLYDDYSKYEEYQRVDDNKLYQAGSAAYKRSKIARNHASASTEYVRLDFNQPVGGRWTVLSETYTDDGETYSDTVQGTYRGIESVSTPAGTFPKCAKFEMVSTTTSTGGYSYKLTEIMWLAPNVGMVKFSYTEWIDGSEYGSSEDILTYYSIPSGATGMLSITGIVTESNGNPLTGVTVTISGNASETQTVNIEGKYSLNVVQGGTYTVIPSKTQYTFSPTSKTFTNVTANQTQNFTATLKPYPTSSVFGIIVDSSGKGVAGVIVNISEKSTVTNSSGTYSFTGLSDGSYSMSFSKEGYAFDPSTVQFVITNSDKTLETILATYTGEASTFGKFIGSWINEDKNTGGITKIVFRQQSDIAYVHMWGECSPTDCDWGEETTNIADANDNQLSIEWDQGFSIVTQVIYYLNDGRIKVDSHTHYTDNSNRYDSDYTYYFSKN